jgi:hypothetical protein
MKWLVLLVVAASCQNSARVDDAYAADIVKLCDSVSLAGAENHPDQAFVIAQWLSANLTTSESRAFLVKIQPLTGEPKARALDDEARRVGMSECALSAVWRQPSR